VKKLNEFTAKEALIKDGVHICDRDFAQNQGEKHSLAGGKARLFNKDFGQNNIAYRCCGFNQGFPNTRIKRMGLWTTLMLLYIYCDIYSTFRTGYLQEAMAGKMGPFEVSQTTLAIFGALTIPTALMVAVSLFAKAGVVKRASIIVGVAYTVVNISNLIGETWVYYWIYGTLELAITVFIIIVAARWPKEENNNA
jgi:hypothetical protein